MKYTDEELIEELHRVSEEYYDNGYRVSKNDMEEYGNISTATYSNRFGSWSEAIEKAGLSDEEVKDKKIDKGKLVSEMNRLSEKYCDGGSPSQKIMEEHGKYSVPTYYNRFGSWNEALEECGFELNTILGATDEEVLNEIKRVSEKYCDGNTPRQEDMIKHGKWYRDIYLERFGSWSEAVEKAGFEANTPYEFIKSGSKNPLWREDKGYGDSWKRQKKKALKRDNYRCRVCLKSESEIGRKPSVHHIKPKYEWDVKNNHERMNSLENLVCLCVSCHRKLEENFKESNTEEFITKSREFLGMNNVYISSPQMEYVCE